MRKKHQLFLPLLYLLIIVHPADHSLCDELFDYEQGVGRLLWKGKLYRLDAEQK